MIENRPGNSSMIAAESVVRAPADGYTVFMATIANTLNPAETKSMMRLCFALPSKETIREGVATLARVCYEVTGIPELSANIRRSSATAG